MYMLHVHHMNENDDEIMILNIYIYVICALYEQDDECMFYVHHIKFYHTAP